MKAIARSIIVLSVLLLGTALLAIQQAGPGIFVNGEGNEERQPVEEWFRLPYHWQAGVVLPGIWTASPRDATLLVMDNPGAVFGISARSITVVKDKTGAVREVIAGYDETTSRKSRAALLAALQKNIGVFTGTEVKKLADGSLGFTGGGLSIILATAGGVTVTLSRA